MSRISDAISRLKAAATRIPTLHSPYPLLVPEFGPGCHEAEIEELEGQTRLPEGQREFLLVCRRMDASDVHNGYFLFSPIGIATTDGPRRLYAGNEPHLEEVSVSPIGGDGGGNLFLIGRSPNALGWIWKWNHEYPPRVDGVAREGLLLVSRSFEEFLERIADDWEHFVSQDGEWDYISG